MNTIRARARFGQGWSRKSMCGNVGERQKEQPVKTGGEVPAKAGGIKGGPQVLSDGHQEALPTQSSGAAVQCWPRRRDVGGADLPVEELGEGRKMACPHRVPVS